jgi:hypothetical protein
MKFEYTPRIEPGSASTGPGAGPGAGARWVAVEGFVPGLASTPTSIAVEAQGILQVGQALRLTVDGAYIYAIVRAVNPGEIVFWGYQLYDENEEQNLYISALEYDAWLGGVIEREFMVPGILAFSEVDDALWENGKTQARWGGPPAALVRVTAIAKSATANATIQVWIGGAGEMASAVSVVAPGGQWIDMSHVWPSVVPTVLDDRIEMRIPYIEANGGSVENVTVHTWWVIE